MENLRKEYASNYPSYIKNYFTGLKIMISAKEIQTSTKINSAAKKWALENIDYLNRKMRFLGSSIKVEKGEKEGYITAILYLQPADKVALKTLCAASALFGCKESCLISSGQLGMSVGQNAATKRTILFLLRPDEFKAQLNQEIRALQEKHGDKLAIRLNGTSDINWQDVIAANPQTRFYNYTKIYHRVINNKLGNYDLTFSGSAYSEKTIAMSARAHLAGHRTVIAFNTKNLAGEFQTPENLNDFDDTDLRFLDPHGVIGKLKRKGSSKAERAHDMQNKSFFFTPETYLNLTNIIARG